MGSSDHPGTSASAGSAARKGAALLLALAFAAWLFAWVHAHAPVLPMCDGWAWIGHARAFEEGGLAGWWGEHPLVHAQHVYLLPASVALLLGPLFDWSFRPFAFLALLLLLAGGALAARWARKQGLGSFEVLAVFLLAASFRHHENLLFGFQFGLVLSAVLGASAVVVAAEHRGARGGAWAGLLAVGAALSSSAGLFACVLVVLVRTFEVGRAKPWVLVAAFAALLLGLAHFVEQGWHQTSFVADGFERLAPERAHAILAGTVEMLGGAFVGGRAAAPAGLVVLCASIVIVASRVRAAGRIDATAGLVLLGVASSALVAVARAPFVQLESRHALFATPAAVACAVEGLRWLRSRPSFAAAAALAVVAVWIQCDARSDADLYAQHIAPWEMDQRLYVAGVAGDGVLTREELGQVNPGEPATVRALMEFAHDERLSIFSPRYRGIEVRHALPLGARKAIGRELRDGVLAFHGEGQVCETIPCAFESGCTARLSVELAVQGRAVIGFIVRGPGGEEKSNTGVPVRNLAEFATHSARVTAARGDTLEPYVFAYGPEDRVRVRSFCVVLAQNAIAP